MMNGLLKKAQKEHFDSIAKEYAQRINLKGYQYYFGITSGEILDGLKTNLQDFEHAAGLDVGCGNGDLTAEIRKRCFSMAGTDLSEGMIGIAREIHSGSNLEFLTAASDELPFGDSVFDFSVTTHLFHHLVEDELINKTLAEMKRVTRKNGLIISVDTNKMNPVTGFGQDLMVKRGVDTGLEKLIWPQTILRLMRNNELQILRHSGYCLIPHWFPRLRFLSKYLEATFMNKLGKDYIIVARVNK